MVKAVPSAFKDTIIIMTSNAGTGKAEANVGFGAAREGRTNSVLGELGNFFSPEFMNRFDGIIEFQPLSKKTFFKSLPSCSMKSIKRLAQNEIHLDVTEKVKEKLVDLGYDPKMGGPPTPSYHPRPYRRCYYRLLPRTSK